MITVILKYLNDLLFKTTESASSSLYLDILLEKDIDDNLTTKLCEKRVDINFPYLCSNLLSSPVYGVFVSQII